MNKYLSIFSTSIKQEKKTLGNTLISLFSFFVIMLIFYQLWDYIYGNNIQNIGGYNLDMTIWYLIIAEMLTYCVSSRKITKNFASDIKTGKIAYALNKPYNYFIYQIVTCMATAIWKMFFMIPESLVCGLIFLGNLNGFRLEYFLPFLLCLLLACLVSTIIYGTIGLLAFWIEEPSPFTWIVQKFVLLLGLFFPPEFFPSWLQPIIKYSPIYVIMSGPSSLFANFSWQLFSQVFGLQVIYAVILFIFGMIWYKFGTRKVNINGG